MTVYLKYNLHHLRKVVVKEQLQKLGIDYSLAGLGELKIQNELSQDGRHRMELALKKYGIEILDDHRTVLIQRIKDAVAEMVYDEGAVRCKLSAYLSEKLGYSYTHLSSIFPEDTHTSIENYVILVKIDYVKHLLVERNLTLTEVAHKLDYSSLAHLSSQFKKATGLTPSAFQRIVKNRK